MKKFKVEFKLENEAPTEGLVSNFLKEVEVKTNLGLNLESETGNYYECLLEAFSGLEAFYNFYSKTYPELSGLVSIGRSGSHLWIHDHKESCRVGMLWLEEIKEEVEEEKPSSPPNWWLDNYTDANGDCFSDSDF